MPNPLLRLWNMLRAVPGRAGSATPSAGPVAGGVGSQRQKILCVSHDAGFFGAQILVLHIARHLKEQIGLEVTTVLLGGGPMRDEFAQLGAVLDFSSPSWREPASPGVIRKRRAALKRLARAGHKHALCNSAASGNVVPLLKAEGFKTLALVHELPNLPQGLFRLNPNRNQRSGARAELLAHLRAGAESQLVLAAGSSDRRMGLDLFVTVAAAVVRELPSTHFVWSGDDSTELALDCRARMQSLGMTDHVRFLGVLKDPDLYARRIAAADLYLLTSREDPFASVLDGMTAGAPTNPGQAAAMCAAGQSIIGTRYQFDDCVRGLSRPCVSVIVPNYNYAHYVPERLASILNQTCRPFEIIFLDDCSSDGSAAVATNFLKDSGIPYQVIVNRVNAGCYAQWLRGFALAHGDLVWIAEADDTCDAGRLEAMVAGFDDASVTLAYCQLRKINAKGRLIRSNYHDYTDNISVSKWLTPYLRHGVDETCDALAIKNTILNVSAVLMRKPMLDDLSRPLLNQECRRLAALCSPAGDWLGVLRVRGAELAPPARAKRHQRRQPGTALCRNPAGAGIHPVALPAVGRHHPQDRGHAQIHFRLPEAQHDRFPRVWPAPSGAGRAGVGAPQ